MKSTLIRKKPWNRINLPVYSISSKKDGSHNMNIITYASQISMKPKRFVCGIYYGTKTLANAEFTGEFVLQLLAAEQYRLIDLLGKKSGNSINKISRLYKKDLLIEWNGFMVLKDALAVLHLKIMDDFDGGDHKGFLCDVLAYKNLQEGDVLTLDILRAHKLIRI